MRYFSEEEFKRATPSCSIEDMSSELLEMLDIARFFSGIPYVINSAYRTLGYELEQGRGGSSSHTLGKAVDIRVRNSRERYLILNGLMKAGFTRIGIGKDFIHADIDSNKDDEVIWDYYE